MRALRRGLTGSMGMLARPLASPLAPRFSQQWQQARNTTILCVRKGDRVVMMGDGQATLGEKYIAKSTTKKLRRAGDNVMVGFAGSTADAMTLLEKLEGKLTEFPGQLLRACVELAKEWRGDKYMRQLNASMIVASEQETLEIDGLGNVITPEEDGVLAIGSGGLFAKAAARALVDLDMDAEGICQKAMKIAVSIDVHSNDKFTMDSLTKGDSQKKADEKKAEKEEEESAAPKLKVSDKPPEETSGLKVTDKEPEKEAKEADDKKEAASGGASDEEKK